MSNIIILVTMFLCHRRVQLQLMTFLLQTIIYNEHVISFFTDHLDLLVNISRIYLLTMLPLKTKTNRLIPNQESHTDSFRCISLACNGIETNALLKVSGRENKRQLH